MLEWEKLSSAACLFLSVFAARRWSSSCTFVPKSGGADLPVGSGRGQMFSQEAAACFAWTVCKSCLDWGVGVRSDPTLTPTLEQ